MNHENFLNDMYCFYSFDPSRRGMTSDGTCCYLTDDGKKCAIGRYVPEHFLRWDNVRHGPMVNVLVENNGHEVLGEIKNLDVSFLRKVQRFHDNEVFWFPDSAELRRNKYQKLLGEAKDLDSGSTPSPTVGNRSTQFST